MGKKRSVCLFGATEEKFPLVSCSLTCAPSPWSWWNRGWGWASCAGWSGGWAAAFCSACRGRNTPENKNKITGLTRSPHFYKSSFAPWHLLIRSYCQTLWEIKAILTEGGSRCSADGAEEPGLVEAQLLQLLRVLCQRGRKQQLLQRHLRWRQTAYKHESCGLFSRFRPLATVMLGWAKSHSRHDSTPAVWQYSLKLQGSAVPGCRDVCGLSAPENGRPSGVRFASWLEHGFHHLAEPQLVHAVNHPVRLINNLDGKASHLFFIQKDK